MLRYRFVAAIASIGISAAFLTGASSTSVQAAEEKTLYLYTYGGSYLEALRDVVINPFEAETGIKVIVDDSCCTKIGAGMAANDFVADVLLGQDWGAYANYDKQGWLVHDQRLADIAKARHAAEYLVTPALLILQINAYIMASGDMSAPMPQSWQEFWDVTKFPGARGFIRSEPSPQLEAALLAGGKKPEELYPLDVDAAFKQFDKLRGSTKVLFAPSGADQINFLATGETKYSLVYANRAVQAIQEGIKLQVNYGQNLQVGIGGGILKGAKDVDAAVKFLEYHYRPEVLAKFAERTGLAPAYSQSAEMVSAAAKPLMPTSAENIEKGVVVDVPFWTEHRQSIYDRWVKWLAQ